MKRKREIKRRSGRMRDDEGEGGNGVRGGIGGMRDRVRVGDMKMKQEAKIE